MLIQNVCSLSDREVVEAEEAEVTKEAKRCFHEADIPPYPSHKAFEARPPVTWNKGRAAIYILRYMVDGYIYLLIGRFIHSLVNLFGIKLCISSVL